jgi:hypothetical protein
VCAQHIIPAGLPSRSFPPNIARSPDRRLRDCQWPLKLEDAIETHIRDACWTHQSIASRWPLTPARAVCITDRRCPVSAFAREN